MSVEDEARTTRRSVAVGEVVGGRAVGHRGLGIGVTSPYPQLRQYVFSTTLTSADPEVEIVSSDPVEFVRTLKQRDGMGIWLCGGAGLAGALLPEIDELVIKRNPIAIGSGIPLFHGVAFAPTFFTLTENRTFRTGAAIQTYTRA